MGSGLESEQCEDRRQKQHGCYDREDDLDEDGETFGRKKLEIFVSSLEPLLMTTEDFLDVYIRTRLHNGFGENRIREDACLVQNGRGSSSVLQSRVHLPL